MSTSPVAQLRKVIPLHCAATLVDAMHTWWSNERSQREIRVIVERVRFEGLWETVGQVGRPDRLCARRWPARSRSVERPSPG